MPRSATARALALSVYLPTLLAEIGIGAALPVLTLSALALGEPAAVASIAVAVYSAGRIGGAAVGGRMASHRGSLPTTFASYAVIAGGALVCAVAPNVVVLAVGIALLGLGHGAVHVARQAHIDALAPVAARARSLTTLAGVWRAANFVGPFLGAGFIAAWGLGAAYVLAAGLVVIGVVVLAMTAPRHLAIPRSQRVRISARDVITRHSHVLSTLGTAVMLMGALRQARVVVIPLWAEHLGMSDARISVLFGVATAIDVVMFVPAGYVMDRVGRVWAAVPAAIALGVGAAVLPLTSTSAQVAAVAVLLGAGNGWSSGLVMTLGADAAPEEGRALFLGAWSILQDVGGLLGPGIVAAGAALALPAGFVAMGGVGAVATGAFLKWIPRGTPAASARG